MSAIDPRSSAESPGRIRIRPPEGFRELAREEIEQSLPSRFEWQVARAPDRLAVRAGSAAWTYAELNAAANRIARAILRERGTAAEPVALLLAQGAPLVAAILGALKAGKLYVPLDSSHPRARLAETLAESGAALLLADETNGPASRDLAGIPRRVLAIESALAADEDGNPDIPISPDAGAYIFYTSGSTGRPKGVVDTHRNVLHNVLRYTNSLAIAPSDRLSLIQSCSFSGTVSSLFGALANGAAICPFDLRTEGALRLADYVAGERITIFHSVPSIFRSLVACGRRFPDLRLVRLEGDRATRLDAELYREHLEPECVLVNGLGTTETGLCLQYFVDRATPLAGELLPIGCAVEDMRVHLLDENGRPVEPGRTGELAVESTYLASGYWKRPDLDRAAFRPAPAGRPGRLYRTGDLGRMRPDGCLEYLGRIDFQSKVLGQRIEVAEVECALLALDGIREAAAATRVTTRGEARLVAYVVTGGGSPPASSLWRRALSQTLPRALIPSAFVTLESLPVDANGKLDRRALPASHPDAARAPYVAPRDALERDLARIWEAELGVRRVGVHDDFFELGGDSLTAASVATRMVKTLRLSAPPEILFAAPSVAELASLLRRGESHRRLDSLVALAPGGDRPPIFLVPAREVEFLLYSELARRLGSGQPSYVYRWTLSGDGRGLPSSVEEMAAEGVEGIRRVQPRGPYRLGGFCFGGVVALEMARQIRESGEEVASLALIQVSPYDFPGLVAPAAVARYRQKRRREKPPERRARRAKRLRRGEEERTLSYVSRLGGLLVEAIRSQGIRLGRASAGRARDLAWKAACRGLEALGRPIPLRLRDPERMVARVFGSYRARPDVGRVAVFLPRFSREAYSDDPERDFAGLSTGTLTLSELPCRDGEMLLEPNVSALARSLSDLLSEVVAPFPTNGQPRRPGL